MVSAGYRSLSAVCPNVRYINAFELLGDPWEAGPLAHPTVEGNRFLADALLRRVLADADADAG